MFDKSVFGTLNASFVNSADRLGRGLNLAADYGVEIITNTPDPGSTVWMTIGTYHLSGYENRGKRNIFIETLDENGQRLDGTKIGWNWAHSGTMPSPAVVDKPANEPGANIPLFAGQDVSIWILDEDTPSDLVGGIHSNHPDEDEPNGEKWNTVGHHSFYVVFQRRKAKTPPLIDLPAPDTPDTKDGQVGRILRVGDELKLIMD